MHRPRNQRHDRVGPGHQRPHQRGATTSGIYHPTRPRRDVLNERRHGARRPVDDRRRGAGTRHHVDADGVPVDEVIQVPGGHTLTQRAQVIERSRRGNAPKRRWPTPVGVEIDEQHGFPLPGTGESDGACKGGRTAPAGDAYDNRAAHGSATGRPTTRTSRAKSSARVT